jgi:hypothetical protein
MPETNLGVYPKVYLSAAVDRFNSVLALAKFDECKEEVLNDRRILRYGSYRYLNDQRTMVDQVFSQMISKLYEVAL